MYIKKIKNKEFADEILKLRNQKYVIANSLIPKKISNFEHNVWIKKFSKKNIYYLLFKKKKFVGYIRANKCNNEISWAIYKKYWGKINFNKILKKFTKKNDTAKIKLQNISSLIVALKAGFKIISFKKKILLLKK